jgi:hypothetical protein|tara:strand:- start:10702 stop:12264 length:1563 start_codon:yes stop_codon:yes gene_type:complete
MPKQASRQEQQLITDVFSYACDPLGYVMYAFPWGKSGTPLAGVSGPREWQLEILEAIRVHIIENKNRMGGGRRPEVFQLCRASGRGIGKSALFAMLSLWFISCHPGATVIISANTEDQLKSRTMAELGKWLTLSINNHWFEKQKMKIEPAGWYAELLRSQMQIDTDYFYIDGQLWSADNPSAFAGVHNTVAGTMVLFDEAATIPAPIWDITSGFFSDMMLHRYWLNFSNGRLNTGAFYDCFHGPRRPFWRTACIDSRDVEGYDPGVFKQIIDTHGEDSDVARVEVKGQFPRQGEQQFISREVVEMAQSRDMEPDNGAPLLLGVDVARFGDDATVLYPRQGRDARSLGPVSYRKLDTGQVAQRVAEWCDEHNPKAVLVDGGGVGGGVVDSLKAMGYPVIDVNGGERPDNRTEYTNKRAEMWDRMKKWLAQGGCLWKDMHKGQGSKICPLETDLLAPNYDFDLHHRLKLERKDMMKKRGVASPDMADALALTFAKNFGRSDSRQSKRRSRRNVARGMDYAVI